MTRPVLSRVTSIYVAQNAALFIVLLVSALHLAWALLLAFEPAAAGSTPVAALITVFHNRLVTVAVLVVTSLLALVVAWYQRNPKHPPVRAELLALALIPQQILLLISAFGGIHAAVIGHYADGVVRPWQFIISDQLPVIFVAFLYSAALVVVVWTDRQLPRKPAAPLPQD